MSEQYLKWFNENIGNSKMFSEEEKEELQVYTWLAWRDSNRQENQSL